MSEESPHFNELFVQEDKKDREYNLDSNLLTEGKEQIEEFDRKIVGFDSIDDLFSSLGPQKLKEGISNNADEVIGQSQARVIIEKQASKNSSSRLPNITINYSQPSARNSSINHKLGTLPTKRIETKAFKKKIVEYQKRIIQVPIEKEVIECYEVQHVVDRYSEQTKAQNQHKCQQNLKIQTTKNCFIQEPRYPVEERQAQNKVRQQKCSFLERIKSEPSLKNQKDSINPFYFISNFRNLNNQHQNALKNLQNRFVTCDNYDYRQRKMLIHQLDSKMQYLKQLQAKFLKI